MPGPGGSKRARVDDGNQQFKRDDGSDKQQLRLSPSLEKLLDVRYCASEADLIAQLLALLGQRGLRLVVGAQQNRTCAPEAVAVTAFLGRRPPEKQGIHRFHLRRMHRGGTGRAGRRPR